MNAIYGLFDPNTDELRYVGKTVTSLKKRLSSHLNPSNSHTHTNMWIRSLRLRELRPKIGLIEVVPNEADLNDRERYWIKYFRLIGGRLTNHQDGGSSSGENHRRTRASVRGKPFIDDTGREWVSQSEAARFYGASQANIAMVLREKRAYAAGHVFRFKDEIAQKGLPQPIDLVTFNLEYRGSQKVIDNQGQVWRSCTEAANYFGVSPGTIRNVCVGINTSWKGRVFRFKKDGFPSGFDIVKYLDFHKALKIQRMSKPRRPFSDKTKERMSEGAKRRWRKTPNV